jgi:hypothetical protein
MVRAEAEFQKEAPNYQFAYDEYEKVLAYKDSSLYDIALFKSAWTLWRLGQKEEAFAGDDQPAKASHHHPPVEQQRRDHHAGQNYQQIDRPEHGPADDKRQDKGVVPSFPT